MLAAANDLDERLVNLYRVLQDEAQCRALINRLTFTPYSRAEFIRALQSRDDPDPVTAAWAMYTAQNQGFGGQAASAGNWGRAFSARRSEPRRWCSRLRLLSAWHDRLTHAYLDCRDACDVIRAWDSPGTLFYLDPPYPCATRAKGSRVAYRLDVDDTHHQALLALVPQLQGRVVLSSYQNAAYDRALAGWQRRERPTTCHAAGRVNGSKLKGTGAARANVPRTEVLWLNPAAAAACKAAPGLL